MTHRTVLPNRLAHIRIIEYLSNFACTCWQVRKSATHTNTPAMPWAARVCRKIGVPSFGVFESMTSVVVDILTVEFTYEACVPVTATPFIRQPVDESRDTMDYFPPGRIRRVTSAMRRPDDRSD